MNFHSTLINMTIEEKIQAMEAIWEDLTKNADDIKSPSWHGEVLINRDNSIKNGKDDFIEWSEAKNRMMKSINN